MSPPVEAPPPKPKPERSLSARCVRLDAERERLRRRSMQLRERIAYEAQALNPTLKAVDSARSVGDWVQGNPQYLLGGALATLLAIVVARPRRVLSLGLRLWGSWRMVKRFLPLIRLALAGHSVSRRR